MYPISSLLLDFFFSYSVPSVIYTLSLHDALPIFVFMVVLQMAFLTPPFGFAIFYLKSAVGEKVGINRIYKATIPFITIQLIATIILIVFPKIFVWLPNILNN